MKGSLILASAALQGIAVTALPVTLAGELLSARDLDARAPPNPFAAAAKALGGGGNGESVSTAATSFAGDVAIVSSSLNGSELNTFAHIYITQILITPWLLVGQTTDPQQIRTMARKAFVAEKDEDQHRAVLDDGASGGAARQANQKIVDNTPIVLDGLQSMMQNPSMANVMRQLSKVESARYARTLACADIHSTFTQDASRHARLTSGAQERKHPAQHHDAVQQRAPERRVEPEAEDVRAHHRHPEPEAAHGVGRRQHRGRHQRQRRHRDEQGRRHGHG